MNKLQGVKEHAAVAIVRKRR